MKCYKCNRPLTNSPLLVHGHYVGPVCAKLMRIEDAHKVVTGQLQTENTEQMDLFVKEIKQGHKYRLGSKTVIAMDSGVRVMVGEILEGVYWPLGASFEVSAGDLVPLPMKYFGGEVPG